MMHRRLIRNATRAQQTSTALLMVHHARRARWVLPNPRAMETSTRALLSNAKKIISCRLTRAYRAQVGSLVRKETKLIKQIPRAICVQKIIT
jgi:hypothetical protein